MNGRDGSGADSAPTRKTLQGVAVVPPSRSQPVVAPALDRAPQSAAHGGPPAGAIPNPANALGQVPPIPRTPPAVLPAGPTPPAERPPSAAGAGGHGYHEGPVHAGAAAEGWRSGPEAEGWRTDAPQARAPRVTAPLPSEPSGETPAPIPFSAPAPRPGAVRAPSRADGAVGDGPIRVVCRSCQRPVWGWKLPFGVSCPLAPHHAHLSWTLVGVVASFWTVVAVLVISMIALVA